jgi:hypothetical protein
MEALTRFISTLFINDRGTRAAEARETEAEIERLKACIRRTRTFTPEDREGQRRVARRILSSLGVEAP